jgi:hypothetical protein
MKASGPKILVILYFLVAFAAPGFSQLKPVSEIDVKGDAYTSDYLGNIYVAAGAVLTRYDLAGRFTGSFRSGLPGNINQIDASNPLQLLLFYKEFNRLIIVDRNLVQASQPISLNDLGVSNAEAVCFSARGGLWVLDWYSRRVLYYDHDFRLITQIPLVSGLIREEDTPLHMTETNGYLYISFAASGLWRFDRTGSYQNYQELIQMSSFQVLSSGILFTDGRNVVVYDPLLRKRDVLVSPEQAMPVSARKEGDSLLVFTTEKIFLYKVH